MDFVIYNREGGSLRQVQSSGFLTTGEFPPDGKSRLDLVVACCRYMRDFRLRHGIRSEYWVAVVRGFTVEWVEVVS